MGDRELNNHSHRSDEDRRSDEELMKDFQQGQESAFRDLFARYKDPVFGFVRRRVSSAGRAEEITQDVFLAVVKNRNGYRRRASFRTYLYRIAHNRVVSEYRSRKNEEPLAEVSEPAAGGDESVARQVRDALARIDSGQREAVMLREYEGLSYDEISRVLRIPVGTVRSRLFRGKMALRDLLASPTVPARKE